MEVVAVRVDIPGNAPVLVLREVAGAGRLIPIFIGQAEAGAIGFALEFLPIRGDLLVIGEEVVVAEVVAELLLRRGDRALGLCR